MSLHPCLLQETKNPDSFATEEIVANCEGSTSFWEVFEQQPEEESSKSSEDPLPSSPFVLPATLPIFPLSNIDIGKTPQVSALSPAAASCLEVWDTLCTEMVLLEAEDVSSTTFTLQGDRFHSSPFQGAAVTIIEYSQAPKIFNVSIVAQEEAVTLLQAHMASFFELLETRNFSFAIHRIDTDIATDAKHRTVEHVEEIDKDDQPDEDA